MVALGVGVLAGCGGYSAAIAWNMTTFLQFVHYLPMMRIFMHTCLVDYCIGFGFFNAEIGAVGAFVSNLLFTNGFPWKAIDYKYIRAGFWFP